MGVQLGVTELTRYGIGPCAHLSIRMHRPVMKINQQMVFGTKRRNMLRPAVLFLHISSHETVFYTGCAPARILCQGFFNGITFTAHIIQVKPDAHSFITSVFDEFLHTTSFTYRLEGIEDVPIDDVLEVLNGGTSEYSLSEKDVLFE